MAKLHKRAAFIDAESALWGSDETVSNRRIPFQIHELGSLQKLTLQSFCLHMNLSPKHQIPVLTKIKSHATLNKQLSFYQKKLLATSIK